MVDKKGVLVCLRFGRMPLVWWCPSIESVNRLKVLGKVRGRGGGGGRSPMSLNVNHVSPEGRESNGTL